jgi:dTDP-4-dehydrorhamnose reductase
MKALVLGAGGVIGQHMRLSVPSGVSATFHRRTKSPGYIHADLSEECTVRTLVQYHRPDVIINLAGESNTDAVERDPAATHAINVELPALLASTGIRLIHISTQAVFSGNEPTYGPHAAPNPINAYGRQKDAAEAAVLAHSHTTVIRPTFVLGVRPDPSIGRQNPIEAMLLGQRKQVADRWFSVSFAPDVAACIWTAATSKARRRIIHAGIPRRVSRYSIARDLGLDVDAVSHEDFPGLAPRPKDTTYSVGEYTMSYENGLKYCLEAMAVAA